MPTYRLDVSYDGSGFHGFARQPGTRTVQGEIEDALETVIGEAVTTVGAGRTDAGVHARDQVVSFPTTEPVATDRLVRSLNGILGPEIAVRRCAEVEQDWSARFSATWRAYRYRLRSSPAPDPLERLSTWHIPHPVDIAAMNAASAVFVGEHDFAGFCRRAEGRSTTRRVLDCGWTEQDEGLLVFSIRATSFCHQMVRSIVGWCVEVGRGRRRAADTIAVLAAGDRSMAGPVAPPHGLVLWEVGYD